MQNNVKKVVELIKDSGVLGSKIILKAEINDTKFTLMNKDIMGNVIQSWLEVFLDENSIEWKSKGTQKYPDFILNNNEYMEVKCFLDGRRPAFDIANFKSFIDSLINDPKRLNSDYLVFSYSFNDEIKLSSYYCKKIWELTSDMPRGDYSGFLSAQVKKGSIYNLRPVNFPKNPKDTYKTRREFTLKVRDRIEKHSNQLINKDPNCLFKDANEWFDLVCENHKKILNEDL